MNIWETDAKPKKEGRTSLLDQTTLETASKKIEWKPGQSLFKEAERKVVHPTERDGFEPQWEDPEWVENFQREEANWRAAQAGEQAIQDAVSPFEVFAAMWGGVGYAAWRAGGMGLKAAAGKATLYASVETPLYMPVAATADWVAQRYGIAAGIATDIVGSFAVSMTLGDALIRNAHKLKYIVGRKGKDSIQALKDLPPEKLQGIMDEMDATLKITEDYTRVMDEAGAVMNQSPGFLKDIPSSMVPEHPVYKIIPLEDLTRQLRAPDAPPAAHIRQEITAGNLPVPVKEKAIKVRTTKATTKQEVIAWGGKSKAVTETGNLLQLFHGTSRGRFKFFNRAERGTGADAMGFGDYGDGFYFTPTKTYARGFAKGEKGEVATVHLNMESPLDLRKYSPLRAKSKMSDKEYETAEEFFGMTQDNWGDWEIGNWLSQRGFDSVISQKGDEFVVFDPAQIKILSWEKLNKIDPSVTASKLKEAATSKERHKIINEVRGDKDVSDLTPYSKETLDKSRVVPQSTEPPARVVRRADGRPFTKAESAEKLAEKKYSDYDWDVIPEGDGWVITLESFESGLKQAARPGDVPVAPIARDQVPSTVPDVPADVLVATTGKPYKTEKAAQMALGRRGLKDTHEIVATDGGYGLREKAQIVPGKVSVKKTKDYDYTGEWEVSDGVNKDTMFWDKETQSWYSSSDFTANKKHHSRLKPLGNDKKEALATLQARWATQEASAPAATAAPKAILRKGGSTTRKATPEQAPPEPPMSPPDGPSFTSGEVFDSRNTDHLNDWLAQWGHHYMRVNKLGSLDEVWLMARNNPEDFFQSEMVANSLKKMGFKGRVAVRDGEALSLSLDQPYGPPSMQTGPDPATQVNLAEREVLIRQVAAKKNATRLTAEDELQADMIQLLDGDTPKTVSEVPPARKPTKEQQLYKQLQKDMDEFQTTGRDKGFEDIDPTNPQDVPPTHQQDYLEDDYVRYLEEMGYDPDGARTIGETLADLTKVIGGKGGLSVEDVTKNLSGEKIEAMSRIMRDLKRYQAASTRAGMTVSEYLQKEGFSQPVAEKFAKYADMFTTMDDAALRGHLTLQAARKEGQLPEPGMAGSPAQTGRAELFNPDANPIRSWFSVEFPWRRIGAAESGFAFKVNASVQEAYILQSRQVIKNLYRGRSTNLNDFSKDEILEVLFLREDPAHSLKHLSPGKQERVKNATKEFDRYLNDSLARLQKEGILKEGFPDTYIRSQRNIIEAAKRELEGTHKKSRRLKLEGQIAASEKLIKSVEGTKYVPIISEWFHSMITNKAATTGTRVVSILNQQKRTIPSFKQLMAARDKKGNPILTAEDIDLGEMIAIYGRRMGKDVANQRIKRALEADGLIRQVKSYKPTYKMSKGRMKEKKKVEKHSLAKSDPGQEWPMINGMKMPFLKGYRAQPGVVKFLDSFYGDSGRTSKFGEIMNIAKMYQFYNPLILGTYNTYQSAMLHGVQSWRIPGHIKKAIRDVVTNSDDFIEATHLGLSSKPFPSPWDDWKVAVQHAKMPMKERVLDMLNPLGGNPIKKIHQLSWDMAWTFDPILRMASYKELLRRGMDKRDAAQLAALFHGDYASVPPSTRRALNKVFFTPTFKIVMGNLHIDMFKAAMKSAASLARFQMPDQKTRVLAGGLVMAVTVNHARDMLMRHYGYERDQYARRYFKQVDTDRGPREIAITQSDPTNLTYKFGHKLLESVYGRPSDKTFLGKFYDEMRYEVHPLWRIGVFMLGNNRDSAGNRIVDPNAHPGAKLGQALEFMVKEFLPLSKELDYRPGDTEERDILDKHFGRITHNLINKVSWPYVRGTEGERFRQDYRVIMKQLKETAELNDGKIEPEMLERARKRIQERQQRFHDLTGQGDPYLK